MTVNHREVHPRTPVLVGVGLQSQRVLDPLAAVEPLTLMRRASHAAAHDAAAPSVLKEIDRVYVPKGRWRYRDPGRAIATSFGSANAASVLARVGVLQESLIADACNNIIAGSADVCLVVGGRPAFAYGVQRKGTRSPRRAAGHHSRRHVASGLADHARRRNRQWSRPGGSRLLRDHRRGGTRREWPFDPGRHGCDSRAVQRTQPDCFPQSVCLETITDHRRRSHRGHSQQSDARVSLSN